MSKAANMEAIDRMVSSAIDRYRLVYLVASVAGVLYTFSTYGFLPGTLAAILLYAMYYLGLITIAIGLPYVIPRDVLIGANREKKIMEINRRLDDGTLEAGSDELEELMTAAGLEPLRTISEYGPVFGYHMDAPMYEFVVAKCGRAGDPLKYVFVGPAIFDDEGSVETPSSKNTYIVLDGYLYEHVPEPKNNDAQE